MKDPSSGLSHFSSHPIRYGGVDFPTSEHACRAAMFMWTAPDVVHHILRAGTPLLAIAIADTRATLRRPDWDAVCVQLTTDICGTKLLQHSRVRRDLLGTGDLDIVLDVNDEFWGIGRNGMGRNEAGKIWMRLRSVLRQIYS